MMHKNPIQYPALNLLEKNQSTIFEQKPIAASCESYIKQVISLEEHWGNPAACPYNHQVHYFRTPQADVISSTTYGGPGSKYKEINEDSYFFGLNHKQTLVSGVIDGAGGSQFGYLGGKIANQSLSYALHDGQNFKNAFKAANKNVMLNAQGGYATGVALIIDRNQTISLGAIGDARAITIRHGKTLDQGQTKIQSEVANLILKGELPQHAIHTSSRKNIIYNAIGNQCQPHCNTSFTGQSKDTIILGSDGLFDVVSDYEITYLAQKFKGRDLHNILFAMAYHRNNSEEGFDIRFSADQIHTLPAMNLRGKSRGDNITVQVVELR